MKKFLVVLLVLLVCGHKAHAQLIINEIMQSNIDCVMDDLNEFPDSWVEVYNAGNDDVNLSAYRLGDSDNADKAWILPGQVVKAGGYALIYCDKEAQGLHTDFRLESGKGCNVYLFKDGEVADMISGLKKQPAPNIAYGRQTDGADEWGYQATPTPGKQNCGSTCKDILGEPVFSTAGKVVTDNSTISIVLTLPEDAPEGTEIRYTTNGSEPTASSKRYDAPIKFSNTTVIRAKLFCDGYLSPRSTTQSYIYMNRELTLPVISIVTDSKYLYDNKIGIYVEGTYNDKQHNYEYDWRRPINIEMYETDGTTCALNQLCETRVQGGATRTNDIKSLAVYANKRFGEKRFKYEFFPEDRPGITDFKSFLLRNSGNDFNGLYLRDAIIQRTMIKHGVDMDWQAWQPAVIFINGKYIGMENIRERSNADNIYTNYDGLEDIDMFENWYDLKEGDWENRNAFEAFYTERGHTWQEFEEWMDVEEFMNLMITNLFFCNLDFPGNNIVMWRPKTEDGRWRWILKDTDFGLGLYGRDVNYNTIEWLYDNNYDSGNAWANTAEATRLFRRLMDDEDFRREFIDHCAIYMGDFLNSKGVREIWDPMYELIAKEYKVHHDNRNPWWPDYNSEVNNVRKWINARPGKFYTMLRNFYGLAPEVPLTINSNLYPSDYEGMTVTMNGIKLTTPVFDGKFYPGRTLHLQAESSKNILGWKVIITEKNGQINESDIDGTDYSFTMPDCKNMVIYALVEGGSGVMPERTHELLVNGDAEKSWESLGLADVKWNDADNYKVCAWGKVDAGSPKPATIEEVDGSHVFVVHAGKCVSSGEASAWDNQFWIEAPKECTSGMEVRIRFRYKASRDVVTNTQVHRKNPGDYLMWYAIGDVHFTTEWQELDETFVVDDAQNGCWSVAFNLNPHVKVATDFYLDDLSWTILNDETSYPDAIDHSTNPRQTTAIYNLSGQRQDNLQRGINIVRYSDGSAKKVVRK